LAENCQISIYFL